MTNNKLSAYQATIVVAVATFFFCKAVVEVTIDLGKLAYKLGRTLGARYYASSHVNPIVSDVTVAIEIEAKVITQQVGNYLCGVALVASYLHAAYLACPSAWEVKLEVRYYLRKLMTSERIVGFYN